jgi:hypothetical protein
MKDYTFKFSKNQYKIKEKVEKLKKEYPNFQLKKV